MNPKDREFLDRVETVIGSNALLGNLRLYFECLGFLKQLANQNAFANPATALRLMDFLDDYLQLVLEQAKADGTTLGTLIWDGYSNPRSARFQEALENRPEP